jgi:hypothetical protein
VRITTHILDGVAERVSAVDLGCGNDTWEGTGFFVNAKGANTIIVSEKPRRPNPIGIPIPPTSEFKKYRELQ